MKLKLLLLMSCLASAGCAHGPCQTLGSLLGCECVRKREQPKYQDMSIQLPEFDSKLSLDTNLDGYTLQAIRVAADDFLNADPTGLPCEDK